MSTHYLKSASGRVLLVLVNQQQVDHLAGRLAPGEYIEAASPDTREQMRRALRAYDLAGPLTENRRQALGEVLTLARQLTEE